MEVVGSVCDGVQLLQLVEYYGCDVVLIDFFMLGIGLDGLELIVELCVCYLGMFVVVFIGVCYFGLFDGLLCEGVSGLVDKCVDFGELLQVLNVVMVGQVFVLQQLCYYLQVCDLMFVCELVVLLVCEQEVLDLLVVGLKVNVIVVYCGCSLKMISWQKVEVKCKLGLQNNQELFVYLQLWCG